tara:strand:+ start:46 stop:936 length:891 start_codon:yes stop_codon:yes gene_type:complete
VNKSLTKNRIRFLIQLLRWNKPSGRLILLIPAGWSLWLTPSAPPSIKLTSLILAGGLFVSGAGCIANDLWDKNIDRKVQRTQTRPLASGNLKVSTAWLLFFIMLSLSLFVVLALPETSRILCLKISSISLLPILIYPSAKRWFKYPQLILAFCWGFAVLLPWAASESSLMGGIPLASCWGATIAWTFGFDTVYGMADQKDDASLGLNSSALSLGSKTLPIVSLSYFLCSLLLGVAAFFSHINIVFWPIWFFSSICMQQQVLLIKRMNLSLATFGRHFKNQVWIGSFLLFGLILGKL